jgi:hypothetical protein
MTTTRAEPAKQANPTAPAVRMIDLDQIDTSSGTESRPLHEDVVDEYAHAWKAGANFPPVDLFWDRSRFHVGDGSHRIAGARKAARTQIAARVFEGTRREALLHSLAANQEHGLRRSPTDKRYAVAKALAELKGFSDRQIAKLIGVSHPFVASCRRESTGNVSSSAETRVGADGKRRKMPCKPPAKSNPASASALPPRWVPPNWPQIDWSAVNKSATALGFVEEGFKQVALPLQTMADGFLTVARCISEADPKMASVVPLVFNALKSKLEKVGVGNPGQEEGHPTVTRSLPTGLDPRRVKP